MEKRVALVNGAASGIGLAVAESLANAGCRTLLVSMDPAHNQRDLFETNFSEKPKSVDSQLSVKEVDTD